MNVEAKMCHSPRQIDDSYPEDDMHNIRVIRPVDSHPLVHTPTSLTELRNLKDEVYDLRNKLTAMCLESLRNSQTGSIVAGTLVGVGVVGYITLSVLYMGSSILANLRK